MAPDPDASPAAPDAAVVVDGAPPPDAAPLACPIPSCGPETPPPPDATLRAVWVGHDVVWALGDTGEVGRRSLSGDAWCWCTPDPATPMDEIWGTGDDSVWLVGEQGRMLHWDGASFVALETGTTASLTDVWASSPANVVVVGDGGIVRRFDGSTWSQIDLGPDRRWLGVWGASADDVWIGGNEPAPYPGNPDYDGESAIIYRWQPTTATWTEEGKFTMYYGAAHVDRIHGTGPDDVWAEGLLHPAGAAAPQGAVFHFDGTTWEHVSVPETLEGENWFSDVAAVGTEVWASGGTATRYFDGATWRLLDGTSANLTSIDGRPGAVWAVGWPAKIARWNGAGWVLDVAVP